MANNREILKHIARGVYATGVSGFDVALWGYLERSEYDSKKGKTQIQSKGSVYRLIGTSFFICGYCTEIKLIAVKKGAKSSFLV